MEGSSDACSKQHNSGLGTHISNSDLQDHENIVDKTIYDK